MILRDHPSYKLQSDIPPYYRKIKVSRDKDGKMNLSQSDVDILKAHVAFVCVWKDKKFHPIGTAFLLSITEPEGQGFDYWITCKHVVEKYIAKRDGLFLRLNKGDGAVGYVPMQGEWVYHPDKNVDLAVLYWLPDEDMLSYELRAIEANVLGFLPNLESFYKGRIREGHDVFLLGLFPKYYGEKKNLPTFRFGNISLITTEKTQGEYGLTDHYFVECDIWPGNSGAPVYVSVPTGISSDKKHPAIPDELVTFYGVASSFYPHRASVKRLLKKNEKEADINEVITHYGISLVTPSDKVADILYGDTMKNKRKKRVDQDRKKNKPEPASVDLDSGETEKENTFTKEDFEKVLRKIARPVKPDAPKKKGK